MRAGDRDGRIQPHQFSQHFSAANDGEIFFARRDKFRVARFNGRRNHDVAGADQIDRIMTDKHADAFGAQPLDVGAVLLVGALHRVALGHQNFSDGAHANAADADDVERTDVGRHLHGVIILVWSCA